MVSDAGDGFDDGGKSARYHICPLHDRPELLQRCGDMLNRQWPISPGYRDHVLRKSRDGFPTSMIMMERDDTHERLMGHVRLRRVVNLHHSLMLNSVLIDEQYRGRQLGKLMLSKCEDWARSRGFTTFYLTTSDSMGFYSKCGYKYCQPVQPHDGSSNKFDHLYQKFQKPTQAPYASNVGLTGDDGGERWMSKDF